MAITVTSSENLEELEDSNEFGSDKIIVSAALGFRHWELNENNMTLHSLGVNSKSMSWQLGDNFASCPRCKAPGDDCHCGFNAYADPHDALGGSYDGVFGAIAGAGHIRIHDASPAGFRSEKAQILAFYKKKNSGPSLATLEELGKKYRVPVFEDLEKFLKFVLTKATDITTLINRPYASPAAIPAIPTTPPRPSAPANLASKKPSRTFSFFKWFKALDWIEKLCFLGAIFSVVFIAWLVYSGVSMILQKFSLDTAYTIAIVNTALGWLMVILSPISFCIIYDRVARRFEKLNMWVGWLSFFAIGLLSLAFSISIVSFSEEKDTTSNVESIIKAEQGVFNETGNYAAESSEIMAKTSADIPDNLSLSADGDSYLVNYIVDKEKGEGIAIKKEGNNISITCNGGYNCKDHNWSLDDAPITKSDKESGDKYTQVLAEPLGSDSESRDTKESRCEDIYLEPDPDSPGSYTQRCRD